MYGATHRGRKKVYAQEQAATIGFQQRPVVGLKLFDFVLPPAQRGLIVFCYGPLLLRLLKLLPQLLQADEPGGLLVLVRRPALKASFYLPSQACSCGVGVAENLGFLGDGFVYVGTELLAVKR